MQSEDYAQRILYIQRCLSVSEYSLLWDFKRTNGKTEDSSLSVTVLACNETPGCSNDRALCISSPDQAPSPLPQLATTDLPRKKLSRLDDKVRNCSEDACILLESARELHTSHCSMVAVGAEVALRAVFVYDVG